MKAIQFNFGAYQHKPIHTYELAQAIQIPRPTKSKYDSKPAVNKSITYIKKN